MMFHVSRCSPLFSPCLEQAEYSYAYEHAFLGASPPKRAQSARNSPTAPMEESHGTYVAPDENVVSEFMEELHEKKTAVSYEAADELAVAGFMDSVRRKKQTLNGLTCGESKIIVTCISFVISCTVEPRFNKVRKELGKLVRSIKGSL